VNKNQTGKEGQRNFFGGGKIRETVDQPVEAFFREKVSGKDAKRGELKKKSYKRKAYIFWRNEEVGLLMTLRNEGTKAYKWSKNILVEDYDGRRKKRPILN